MLLPTSYWRGCAYLAGVIVATWTLGCGGVKDSGLFSPLGIGFGGSSGSAGSTLTPGAGMSASSAGSDSATVGGVSEGGSDSASGGNAAAGAPAGGAVSGGAAGDASGGGPVAGDGNAGSGSGVGGSAQTGGASGSSGASGASGGGSAGCDQHANELCDGIDNNCNGAIDEGACPAKCTGFVASGKSYMACQVSGVQSKAAAACDSQGMRLVWIESAQQNSELLAALQQIGIGPGLDQSSIFIGASDAEQEAHWHWIGGADFWLGGPTGAPVGGAYVNWAAARPNGGLSERCAVMILNMPSEGMPGDWNDSPCTELHGALCETP